MKCINETICHVRLSSLYPGYGFRDIMTVEIEIDFLDGPLVGESVTKEIATDNISFFDEPKEGE